MNILQLCAGFDVERLGGVERYTLDLSRALAARGASVSVAGLWRFGGERERRTMQSLTDAGIGAFGGVDKSPDAPLRNFAASVAALRTALAGRRFDVVHSQQEFGDFAAVALRRAVGARALVRSVHNQPEWRTRPLRRLLFTKLAAPFFFALEAGITDGITDALAARPTARLLRRTPRTLPNAVDLSRFSARPPTAAAARAALGWPSDRPIVGTVGRLTEQKGLFDLLDVAARTAERLPNVQFRVVGDGEQRDALQAAIAARRLDDVVVLDGVRADMQAVYAAVDCLASTSLWEGLPTVILEAMLCGAPVAATAIEGTTQLVRHRRTGLLAPPRDAAAFASALVELLGDPALRTSLAHEARRLAENYRLDRVAERWLATYEELLAASAARSTSR